MHDAFCRLIISVWINGVFGGKAPFVSGRLWCNLWAHHSCLNDGGTFCSFGQTIHVPIVEVFVGKVSFHARKMIVVISQGKPFIED